jgi:hypothetical protein
MDDKGNLLKAGKRKLRCFGVEVVHGFRHTAEKSVSVRTTFALSSTFISTGSAG